MPAGFLGLDGAFLFGAGAAGGSAGGGVGAGRRMSNKPPIILPHTGSSSPSGAGGGGGVVDFFGMAQFPVQRHHSAVLSPCDVSRSWRELPRITEHPPPARAWGAASRLAGAAAGAERRCMPTPDPTPLVAVLGQDERGVCPGCPNRARTTEISGISANTFKCPAGSADTTLWASMMSWPRALPRCPVRSRNSANSSSERRPSGLSPSSVTRRSRDEMGTNASITGETCIGNNHSDGGVHAATLHVGIRTELLTGDRPALSLDVPPIPQPGDSGPETVQRNVCQNCRSRQACTRPGGRWKSWATIGAAPNTVLMTGCMRHLRAPLSHWEEEWQDGEADDPAGR